MSSPKEVVEAYLDCIRKRDLSDAPFTHDVLFQDPLSVEPIRGPNHVARFIQAYLPVVNDVKVIRHIADGNYVATLWRCDTTYGKLTLFQYFLIEDGKIAELRSFFDPRTVLENMGNR